MIKYINNYKEVEGLFHLAEIFSNTSQYVEYNKDAMLFYWKYLLESKTGVLIAWVRQDKIIGVIGGVKNPDITSGILTASEMFWFVDPKYRGIGQILLSEFEKWAKTQGCKRVLMVTLLDSMAKKVMSIYKKRGYSPLEVTYIKEV